MNYVQVQVNSTDTEQHELLIALLADTGFEGFEETGTALMAFIKEAEFNKAALDEVIASLNLNYTSSVIPRQNWNAKWESSFEPVIVNDFASVRAAFHPPVKNVRHEIIITPKMSFGTGHHATTFLMMGQMADLDLAGKTVLDFGTGTAVLAILAEKMGAADVDAIDNDDWSIENSKENIKANDSSAITLHKADTIQAGKTYDIILANINLNVILANLAAIVKVSRTGTLVLLSGFLKDDEATLSEKLSVYDISHARTVQKGEWICILIRVN